MKYVVLIVTVIALAWFGFTRYFARSPRTAENASAAVPVAAASAKPVPPPSTHSPAPATIPRPVAPQPTKVAPPVASAPTSPAPKTEAPIKIDLAQTLGPDNHYHDAAVGVDVMLPAGWAVRDATRWGTDHSQNTVFLKPDVPSSASPSMYYKPYTAEETASLGSTGAQALLREQAQKKEASRVSVIPDYQNVPDSFSFFDVNGSPAMSYFATFTRGDEVMTEHFIRVLGPKGYVMFFTTGKFEDVKAIMPQLKQAASTVKGP